MCNVKENQHTWTLGMDRDMDNVRAVFSVYQTLCSICGYIVVESIFSNSIEIDLTGMKPILEIDFYFCHRNVGFKFDFS